MSDREALKIFSRQPVSNDMINYLVSTTNSIIQIKSSSSATSATANYSSHDYSIKPVFKRSISLVNFIKNLIKYSNVQTPTLMATLIYLNKLRHYLPANAIGMETTRHRIFLSALILSAKSLNDSLPLNKHWTKYTDGLLNIDEVNMAERELINLLNWNININEEDLIIALQPFLLPIKLKLSKKLSAENNQKINYYRSSVANLSNYSLASSTSNLSISSHGSNASLSSYQSHQSHSNHNLNHNFIYQQPSQLSSSSNHGLTPPNANYYPYRNSSVGSISSINSPNSLKSSNSANSISSHSSNGSDYRVPLKVINQYKNSKTSKPNRTKYDYLVHKVVA